MMPSSGFPDWHAMVRRHFRDTAGYVVAESGDCLGLQRQEAPPPTGRVKGRDFRPLRLKDLASLEPPTSWFLGVLLCPGDDLSLFFEWYASLGPKDRDRVALFVHARFAWAGLDDGFQARRLPLPVVVPLRGGWPEFHHKFGRLHGDRVYRDHLPEERP